MGVNTLYCSFCGKSQHEVKRLIAGPTVFICDECTVLCADIIVQTDIEVVFATRLVTRNAVISFLDDTYTGEDLMKEAFGLSLEGTGHEGIRASQVLTQLYGTLSDRIIPHLARTDLDFQSAALKDEIEQLGEPETPTEQALLAFKQSALALVGKRIEALTASTAISA